MPLHTKLRSRARRIVSELNLARPSEIIDEARTFMEENPEAVLDLIDLVQQEGNRTKPNDHMIQAYGFLFGSGLEFLRYRTEGGYEWARNMVDLARQKLLAMGKEERLPVSMLIHLVNCFVEARLDPGEELTEVLGDLAIEASSEEAPPSPADIDDMFEAMAAHANGDPFELHAILTQTSQGLPAALRSGMATRILVAPHQILREAGILYLLDPAPEVRRAMCREIARHATPSMLSPVALRRMICLRNWLPENERPELDTAIRQARRNQIECASWPQTKVERILASAMDGAGAQSVFAVVRKGRKSQVASLLTKRAVGVMDAWSIHDMTKAGVKAFLGQVQGHATTIGVGTDFLHALVPHTLAVGREAGTVPLPGFLEFVEAVGIESWQPVLLSAEELVSLLEKDAGAVATDESAISLALTQSGDRFGTFEFTRSWFEDAAWIADMVTPNAKEKFEAKISLVTNNVLEPRRDVWANQFLWTALWMKQDSRRSKSWLDFFLVGRELLGGRPLNEIPAMASIARTTVLVASQNTMMKR